MEPAFNDVISTTNESLTITVVYDNNPFKEGLTTAWGFACVIQGAEKTILFDTGGNSAVLLTNMRQLGIFPKDIDVVVFSHFHGDHVGGLKGILQHNMDLTVYLPAAFSIDFKESLKRTGIVTVEITNSDRICHGVYSTGVLGSGIQEQALMISTDRGLIVITGCAHPGIVHILQVANKIVDNKILIVVGGLHLGGVRPADLGDIIAHFRKLGVERVGPCHCSGDSARRMFKREYDHKYVDVGVGRQIEFE